MTSSALSPSWSVIIPVKPVALGKSRLTGVSATVRRELAQAFALDTTESALSAAGVRRVVVVTNDPEPSAFTDLGADLLADVPDDGINAALVHGAEYVRRRDSAANLVALTGDLPALRPDDLADALSSAQAPAWFVSDAAGLGTTLLAAAAGRSLRPAFGPDSRAAHLRQGAAELDDGGPVRLRRDVDTTADLADAMRLGLGPHTARVVSQLTLGDPS